MWGLCPVNRQTLQKKGSCEWALQESWWNEYGAEDAGGEGQGVGEFEAVSNYVKSLFSDYRQAVLKN